MREWIFMGNQIFVKINLNDLIKKFKIIFNRWKIKYRICTSDPFFNKRNTEKYSNILINSNMNCKFTYLLKNGLQLLHLTII